MKKILMWLAIVVVSVLALFAVVVPFSTTAQGMIGLTKKTKSDPAPDPTKGKTQQDITLNVRDAADENKLDDSEDGNSNANDGVASVDSAIAAVRVIEDEEALNMSNLYPNGSAPEGFDPSRLVNLFPNLTEGLDKTTGAVRFFVSYNYQYAEEVGINSQTLDRLRISCVFYDYAAGNDLEPDEGKPYFAGTASVQVNKNGRFTIVQPIGKANNAPPIRGRSVLKTFQLLPKGLNE